MVCRLRPRRVATSDAIVRIKQGPAPRVGVSGGGGCRDQVASLPGGRSKPGGPAPRSIRPLLSKLSACSPRPAGETIWIVLRELVEADAGAYEHVLYQLTAEITPEVNAWLGHGDWPAGGTLSAIDVGRP